MKADNYINATIKGLPSNEALSRVIVASFASQADPTFEQIADIKTAVSEAVTNSIVHGYEGEEGEIRISCRMHRNILTVEIEDYGRGIPVDYNNKEDRYNWELLFCELYAGGKYNDTNQNNYTLSQSDSKLGIIVGILSIPALIFLFMVIKGKHILSKERFNDKEVIDY